MESVPKASGAPWNIAAIHLQPAAVLYTASLKRCPPEFQMRGIVLATAIFTVAFLGDVIAQKTESLVGTWKLVYASASTPDGKRNDAPFGVNPTGFLTYTSEGRMSAMISYGGRKALSSAHRITAPVDERAQAFATFFAYGGRYSIADNKVMHHVDISSVQNWVGTDVIRLIKFDGDRITLRTPPLAVGGTIRTTELVFERVK
jgi:hypothetical protein